MKSKYRPLSVSRLSICSVVAMLMFAASGGTLTVKFGSAMEVIEGGVTNTYAKDETFVPTAIPCIYKMRPGGMTESQRTFAVTGTDEIRSANVYRFPVYGDGNWVRVALDPYPSSDTTVTLTGYKTSNFYYVDAENGNEAEHRVRHLERLEHIENKVDNLFEFFLQLVGTAEQVGVVLGKAADTGKSVKLTALLVTVHCTELGETQGKVPV